MRTFQKDKESGAVAAAELDVGAPAVPADIIVGNPDSSPGLSGPDTAAAETACDASNYPPLEDLQDLAATPSSVRLSIPLDELDLSAQIDRLNPETVAEYVEARRRGDKFPDAHVIKDAKAGKNYLVDGRHRMEAARQNGERFLICEIVPGDYRAARLAFAASNTAHGLQRTNKTKHGQVLVVLEDQECRRWSDSRIARYCSVSATFVGNVRAEWAEANPEMAAADDGVRVMENGRTMQTKAIGRPTSEPAIAQPREAVNTSNAVETDGALGAVETESDDPAPVLGDAPGELGDSGDAGRTDDAYGAYGQANADGVSALVDATSAGTVAAASNGETVDADGVEEREPQSILAATATGLRGLAPKDAKRGDDAGMIRKLTNMLEEASASGVPFIQVSAICKRVWNLTGTWVDE